MNFNFRILAPALLVCTMLAATAGQAGTAIGPEPQVSEEVPAVEMVIRGKAPIKPPAAAKRSAYEQKKQATGATRLSTLAALQTSYEMFGDRVAEVKGELKGIINSGENRTCWIELEGAMISLAIPSELAADASLRPGTTIRCLVTTNRKPSATCPLAIVAATSEPEAAIPTSTDAPRTTAPEPFVIPPVVGMAMPSMNGGEATTQPRIITPQNAPPPTATVKVTPGLDTQKSWFKSLALRSNRRLNERQADEIANALVDAGSQNALDPRFLAAIISVESDFDIFCKSSSGAMGLGQLMPFNVPEARINDPWNPTQNIHGTARLLRGHLNDYRGRSDATLLAVAAYNAGPGAVRRAGYQVPGGQQVQRYVWKVYYRYKNFAPDMFRQ